MTCENVTECDVRRKYGPLLNQFSRAAPSGHTTVTGAPRSRTVHEAALTSRAVGPHHRHRRPALAEARATATTAGHRHRDDGRDYDVRLHVIAVASPLWSVEGSARGWVRREAVGDRTPSQGRP